MAQPSAAQAVVIASDSLQEQQKNLDEAEFYYRAHVQSAMEVYKKEKKLVPLELRDQAECARLRIEDAKKTLASRQNDMNTAQVRYCAELALRKERTPEGEEPGVDARPANKRKRGPSDDLLPRILKRLQTDQGHGKRVEPGQISTFLSLLEDGTLSLGSKFPDEGFLYSGSIEMDFNNCFEFYEDEFDEVELGHIVHIFGNVKSLLADMAVANYLRPRQMDQLVDLDVAHAHVDMSYLAQVAYKLRIDSRVIGCVAMSMVKGTVMPGGIDDLVASIRKTLAPWQQKQVYGIPHQVKETIRYILGQLASPDSEIVKSMVYNLMHSATVLAKYSCLATPITVALAVSFDPRGELAKNAVNPSAIADTLDHHKKLLATLHQTEESDPPQACRLLSDGYNSHNCIGDFFKCMQFDQRLSPIVPQVTDLVAFLNSRGSD